MQSQFLCEKKITEKCFFFSLAIESISNATWCHQVIK